ncbi:hypothetical protein N7466_008902 [Penicillium verhagenii]|uniref:uncharacterized protein n=1 Tax=Penicillium verhagenii TaxID=1562060 RepID=UPI0025458A45|nr:uncharacterized protein N7466_008902 [Penicillium verhagenii]KAJ5924715.1 hypothetical protein N7466_008902 [Penicillium verhagenii]
MIPKQQQDLAKNATDVDWHVVGNSMGNRDPVTLYSGTDEEDQEDPSSPSCWISFDRPGFSGKEGNEDTFWKIIGSEGLEFCITEGTVGYGIIAEYV